MTFSKIRTGSGSCKAVQSIPRASTRVAGANTLMPGICAYVATAVAADVLAHQKNALVALDRIAKGRAHRLAVAHLNHFGSDRLLLHGVSPIAGMALSA